MLASGWTQPFIPFNAVIFSIFWYWRLVSARQEHINITRMLEGDLLAIEGNRVDCGVLRAQCFRRSYNQCQLCRCERPYFTFVESRNQCAGNLLGIFCPTDRMRLRSRKLPVLSFDRDTLRKPMLSACSIREKNPEFYSPNGTWIQMTNVNFSLEQSSGRNSELRLTRATISEVVSKYPGRIVKVSIRCKSRRSDEFINRCLLFKTAGTLRMTLSKRVYKQTSPLPPTSKVHLTTELKASSSPTTDVQSDETDGKNSQLIWIICTVLAIIIIGLIGIIVFIYCLHKKVIQTSSVSHGPSFMLQGKKSISKSPTQPQQSQEDNLCEEHIYSTISETNADLPTYTSPRNYQELHTGDPDTSAYQSLVPQEVQYVDILSDPPVDTAVKEIHKVTT